MESYENPVTASFFNGHHIENLWRRAMETTWLQRRANGLCKCLYATLDINVFLC